MPFCIRCGTETLFASCPRCKEPTVAGPPGQRSGGKRLHDGTAPQDASSAAVPAAVSRSPHARARPRTGRTQTSLRVCRFCPPNNDGLARYTLKLMCPVCGRPTVDPHGSASTYQPASGQSLETLVRAFPPPGNWPAAEAVEDIRRAHVPGTYGLVHTLGRTRYDPCGGDGAYSKWMQEHFSRKGRFAAGCVRVDQIIHDGPFGTISNDDLVTEFNPVFIKKFAALLSSGCYAETNIIILNWHIRFTNGTPNGWTGRGINPPLVQTLQTCCREANKKLVIVYTIHEASNLQRQLCAPAALVPLNPEVFSSLSEQFPTTYCFQSGVPGLLRSTHTTKLDTIMKLVGAYLGPVDIDSASSNEFFAQGQQMLRLQNGTAHNALALKGIVVFGMIMPRHGLSVETLTLLCKEMDDAGLPADLRIVVAGKESDAKLVQAYRTLAASKPRIHVLGHLNDFADLAGCRYAISFDKLGYRDNASAMVNVLREGHLLFSRAADEEDEDLVDRAVAGMRSCEANINVYYDLLAAQQPRVRNTMPEVVGGNLDKFFRRIATEFGAQ